VQQSLTAIYHVRSQAAAIEARAKAIAIEQSVEMPVEAIDDDFVRDEIIGQVEAVTDKGSGIFEVRIALAAATIGRNNGGYDAGQMLNMLFGNSSLHDDIILHDVLFPEAIERDFGGPRHGLAGLRARVGAERRPLTASALKPQGLALPQLAKTSVRFAEGGLDYIKDDHGFADQPYAPFAARIETMSKALTAAGYEKTTLYVPSLSGDLDAMRRQLKIAAEAGLSCAMVAPMIMGLANFHRLVRDHPNFAFLAHPTLAGAARIAPALLFGKLFRMCGADALIFPNYGGRFGYSPETCLAIASTGLKERGGLLPAVPVPAGGMTRERVPEMLEFYGPDVMLLIGGALLAAGDKLVEAASRFVATVRAHPHD
jgi:ribulose-bisphosphate carboxylase large chain